MWKENTVTCEWEFPHVRFTFSHLNYTHSCSSHVDSNFYMWNPHFHLWNIRETHLPLTASHVKFASSHAKVTHKVCFFIWFLHFYIWEQNNPKKKTAAPPKDLYMWILLNPHVQLNPIPHFHTWTVWKPCEPWTPHVCHMKERHNFHVTHVICRRYHENTTIWVNSSRVHSHLNPVCPLVCMNQSLLKYLLSGLEVMEKTSNYLPLKIHFSKVCVCVWRWVECVITGKTKRSILVHSEADLANNPLCFVFFYAWNYAPTSAYN